MVKRGGRNKLVNKKNIIFLLVALLLISLIMFFLIKSWPIMQERLSDDDKDEIKNYRDKCPNTLAGIDVDQYGCKIIEEEKVRKPTIIERESSTEEEEEEITERECTDSDDGRNIWKKGTCNDGIDKKDYCKDNFEEILYEFECLEDVCFRPEIDCGDYSAYCYRGKCIENDEDDDGDGFSNEEEKENGTDPDDSDDNPGAETTDEGTDCNSKCISSGYVSGRGPFDSMGHCNYPEVGVYLSGNSGDVCCCVPASDEGNGNGDQPICWESDGGNKPYVAGYAKFIDDEYEDICVEGGAKVRECYCLGGVAIKTHDIQTCEYGCEHISVDGRSLGRCRESPDPSTCSDSDGGDKPFVAGYTNCYGNKHKDTCETSNKLKEKYCVMGGCLEKEYTCEHGCEEITTGGKVLGRCKESRWGPGDYITNFYEYKRPMPKGEKIRQVNMDDFDVEGLPICLDVSWGYVAEWANGDLCKVDGYIHLQIYDSNNVLFTFTNDRASTDIRNYKLPDSDSYSYVNGKPFVIKAINEKICDNIVSVVDIDFSVC